MYVKTTHGIKVTVVPTYLDQQSAPAENHYVWAYNVQLENLGGATVQLLSRYWNITDAMGHVQEVRGEGVIGEQPVMGAGESFQYSSGCALHTPSGIMVGNYFMINQDDGKRFEIEIPAFSLDSPYQVIRPN